MTVEKKIVWVGVDASLRGTGLVAIDQFEEIASLSRVAPSDKHFRDEELLDEIGLRVGMWFSKVLNEFDVQGVAIERLAYGGSSGAKDKISAGWWEIRRAIKNEYKAREETFVWPPESVACNTWRSHVITANDRALNKGKPDKNFLKECPMGKLPERAFADIQDYCAAEKRDAMYDLSDAYWIAWWMKNKC